MADPRDGFEIIAQFGVDDVYDVPQGQPYFGYRWVYGDGIWARVDGSFVYTSPEPFGTWTERGELPVVGTPWLQYKGGVWLSGTPPYLYWATTLDGPWTACTFSESIGSSLGQIEYHEASGYWWSPVQYGDGNWCIAATDDLTTDFVVASDDPMVASGVNTADIERWATYDRGATPFGTGDGGVFAFSLYHNTGTTPWTWDLVVGTADDPAGPWTWQRAQRYTATGDIRENFLLPTDFWAAGNPMVTAYDPNPRFDWLRWSDSDFLVFNDTDCWRGTSFGGSWSSTTFANYLHGDGVWVRWTKDFPITSPDVYAGTSLTSLSSVDFEHPDTIYDMAIYYFGGGAWLGYYYPDDEDYWPDYWLAPGSGDEGGGWDILID